MRMSLSLVVVGLIFMAISGAPLKAQTFSHEITNLNPSMAQFTAYRSETVTVHYQKNAFIQCFSQMTFPDMPGYIKCARFENGQITQLETVFNEYYSFHDEKWGSVGFSLSVASDGSAVIVTPRQDQRGIRIAIQKKNENGSYSPWLVSNTVLNVSQLMGLQVSVLERAENLLVQTWHLVGPELDRRLEPTYRQIELTVFPSGGVVSSVLATQHLEYMYLKPRGQSLIKTINDVARQKVIFVAPMFHNDSDIIQTLVCPYRSNCVISSSAAFSLADAGGLGVSVDQYSSIDYDQDTGKIFIFVTSNAFNMRANYAEKSELVTLYPHPHRNIDYIPQFRQYPSNSRPIKLKVLGRNCFALAWYYTRPGNGTESSSEIHWEYFSPEYGYSQIMSGPMLEKINIFHDLGEYRRLENLERLDFSLTPQNSAVMAIYGAGFDSTQYVLQAQVYDPKTTRVGSFETLGILAPGYTPGFVKFLDEGLLFSYLYMDRATNGDISSSNQQILLLKRYNFME